MGRLRIAAEDASVEGGVLFDGADGASGRDRLFDLLIERFSRRNSLTLIQRQSLREKVGHRVRGIFSGETSRFGVGQKGTGSIDAGTKTLWFIVTQRVGARWNEFAQGVW